MYTSHSEPWREEQTPAVKDGGLLHPLAREMSPTLREQPSAESTYTSAMSVEDATRHGGDF